MTTETYEKLISIGKTVWESSNEKRIYLNSDSDLEALGAIIVSNPKYSCEFRGISSKSKAYYDVNKDAFFSDSGDLKDLFRELGYKSGRIAVKRTF